MSEWERLGGFSPHFILEGEGFYVSYNPSVYGGLLNEPTEETALVKDGEEKAYYILNGDFRKQYEKLVPRGFCVCYGFYLINKGLYGSKWSTIEEENNE